LQVGIDDILVGLQKGDFLSIARAISMVENEHPLSEELLPLILPDSTIPIIGITGPPGAGQSTLVNALIKKYVEFNKKVAVLAVDPSSPFNHGALLGDRIRMSASFNQQGVFIRSMASRGSLGGLAEKTIEITDVMRSSGFDVILVETVGVGQSEIDIIGLADLTVVVLVPESGDEIQHAKSGLMEIADIFVVNKADREGADLFVNHLSKMLKQNRSTIPIVKTIADEEKGIDSLMNSFTQERIKANKKSNLDLLTEKAWRLIQQKKMKTLDKAKLRSNLRELSLSNTFNLYLYVRDNY
jgi:LAO/AO transport system kinase